jgi:CBS domain-containing protein
MPQGDVVERSAPSPRLRVADLMTREVRVVRDDCSLTAAMNVAFGSGHRNVVVVDNSRKLLGVLPTEVLATALMTRLATPRQTIGELLVGDPPGIAPLASVRTAAALMLETEVDALGVVDVDGTLLGLLTWSDIGRMVADRGRA